MSATQHPPTEDATALYDEAPCGYLSTFADGTVIRANRTLLGWLGRSAEDLVGVRRFADLLNEGARVIWSTHHLSRLETQGRLDAVALDLVRADGSSLPVLLSAVTVPAAGHDRPLIRLTLVDAGERRAYERDLLDARRSAERAEWRMAALQRVTEVCAAATTETALLDGAVRAVAEGLECRAAAIWLEGEAASLVRAASLDADDPSAPPTLSPDEPHLAARAWRDGGVVRSDGGEQVALPFGFHDERLGVLWIELAQAWRGEPDDLQVLGPMASLLGQALARTRLHERTRHLALHDSLTGLPNRVLLIDRLEQAVARATRLGGPVALLFVDLDDFKAVNDAEGHAVGDRVLAECAERLRAAVRLPDTVARFGGDEFVVLCEDTGRATADEIAARIRAALAHPIVVEGREIVTGASVGVAVREAPFNDRTVDDLLHEGDLAMYADKRG